MTAWGSMVVKSNPEYAPLLFSFSPIVTTWTLLLVVVPDHEDESFGLEI